MTVTGTQAYCDLRDILTVNDNSSGQKVQEKRVCMRCWRFLGWRSANVYLELASPPIIASSAFYLCSPCPFLNFIRPFDNDFLRLLQSHWTTHRHSKDALARKLPSAMHICFLTLPRRPRSPPRKAASKLFLLV
jgi:hypothetical protein